jgi:hypothetical protein
VKVLDESSVSVDDIGSTDISANDGASTDVSASASTDDVRASASTDDVSATGVIIDGKQSDIKLMPSNGSIFGDSRTRNVDLNTSDIINDGEIATKLSNSRSNGSIFGDNSVSTADISEDYSVRDVINAYQEVQIENENKGNMINNYLYIWLYTNMHRHIYEHKNCICIYVYMQINTYINMQI